MNWLINQLFGSQASAHLGDKIKALVAEYVLANPSFTQASASAWVTSQADHLIAQVLVFFPGWASAILTQFLNGEIAKLTVSAFNQITKSPASPAA